MEPLRVVIVEDSEDSRLLMAMQAEGAGDVVATFASALDAIQWQGWDTVDVLVTDQAMPGMSGSELCRWIRSRYPNVRTILSSAFLRGPWADEADIYVDKSEMSTGLTDLLRAIRGDG